MDQSTIIGIQKNRTQNMGHSKYAESQNSCKKNNDKKHFAHISSSLFFPLLLSLDMASIVIIP